MLREKLTWGLLSEPEKMPPILFLPFTCLPPRLGVLSPHLRVLSRSRRARSHPTRTPPPTVPFQGWTECLDSGAAGTRRQEVRAKDRRRPSTKEPQCPILKGWDREVAQEFSGEPGLSRSPNAQALFPGPRCAGRRPALPALQRLSAVSRPQFQPPEAGPFEVHDYPHLPPEAPAGGGFSRTSQAWTLGPTGTGSPALSAHRACAETGVPPLPGLLPANHHSRKHACALASRRPNRPIPKPQDPPFAITKGQWYPIRVEIAVGGSGKSNSQWQYIS